MTLIENVTIPPRSEQVVTVGCRSQNALLKGEFQPKMSYQKGVYVSRAQVVPNISGQFQITLLNTNEEEVNEKF